MDAVGWNGREIPSDPREYRKLFQVN
jgi:hypothetical protein